MLAAATTVKLLAEIALLALFGQWVVGLLAGTAREHNPVYQVLQRVGSPWVKAARWMAPRCVPDRHLPAVAFCGLLLLWVAAAIAKISLCLHIGIALCK